MKRKKSLYLLLVFAGVLGLAFGYANISRVLNINASAIAGPDSNSLKVFYEKYQLEKNWVYEMNHESDDIMISFLDKDGADANAITGTDRNGDVSGEDAVSMSVNIPAGHLVNVGDTVKVYYTIKNFGMTEDDVAAKVGNIPNIDVTYYSCTQGATEYDITCDTEPLEISSTDAPFTMTIEQVPSYQGFTSTSNSTLTDWWTASKVTGDTYGVMNPGETVAYVLTIEYTNNTDELVKGVFDIDYTATEAPKHS